MFFKTVVISILLIGGHFAVDFVRRGYSFGKVVPPSRSLDETPLSFGNWSGREIPADPRLREILRARSGIDRIYRNETGSEVLVHAVWTDDYLQLHFPQQCYRESGWELQSSDDVTVSPQGIEPFDAQLLTFNQEGRTIRVLYWFQLGQHIFLDRIQHRLLRRKVCWGKTEWPPLMKFMLEQSDTGLDDPGKTLSEVASELYTAVFEKNSASSQSETSNL